VSDADEETSRVSSIFQIGQGVRTAFCALLGATPALVSIDAETGKLAAKTFTLPGEEGELLDWLGRCRDFKRNAYFHPNQGSRRDAKQAASDITLLKAVGADVDAKDGVSLADIEARLAALPIQPTVIIMTGGGYQPIWVFSTPIAVSPDAVRRVTDLGKRIRDHVRGDAVFNVDRLYRMPGTTNFPDARKRARGRVEVEAVLAGGSGQTVALEDLELAFPPVPAAASQDASVEQIYHSGSAPSTGWFSQLSPERQDACLQAMLAIPAIAMLADTSDGDPEPNWRTVLAACARSGAPDARAICRRWAAQSDRFLEADFESRFSSYEKG
jgi:hypothetical protein